MSQQVAPVTAVADAAVEQRPQAGIVRIDVAGVQVGRGDQVAQLDQTVWMGLKRRKQSEI